MEDCKYMFKIIDSRTREVLIPRLAARSHTEAEDRAKELIPGLHHVASMLHPDIPEKPKKRTKKR